MKFAVASYGTRGDIEPCLTIGRELMRRGHSVRMAVPPNLVDLAEAAGVPAIPYGPDMHDFWSDEFIRDFFKNFIRGPVKLMREAWEPVLKNWQEMSSALMAVGAGADLLFTGQLYQDLAINVADYYGIPMATLHYIPMRPNGQVVPGIPGPMVRTGMAAYDWMCWRMNKKAEDRQRRELGLPTATVASPRRIAERGSLEIQAYDDVCFPGLAHEWAKWGGQRPFVGSLTMELTTECDDEVLAWIAQGTPPICFGFGSMPVAESPAETVEMIGAACAELGERALICSGWSDFSDVPQLDHVKVVGVVNYTKIFPACRAVVHHGGSGTTAAGLRAGIPSLILWTAGDQPMWGSRVKQLKVGTSRRFSGATPETLIADLRTILAPEYTTRARELATRMSKPAESAGHAVDLLEEFARSGRCVPGVSAERSR
ncbi:glycosyltransferase [Mycobacterium marseillense]|uniref:Glycosyltransferase n=1 Tax=Mycobacterium marseillense TaxID=701042 RepID=A0ABM7J9U8_9MYCO|nr:glycosyltransferase [Mycobacterium marseillense]MCV7407875.1 glycosyltransferase [Mycobacterium marseillense]ORA93322.1 glycosyl transferase family 1 [Mycobacterium marseillense]BBY10655.1 putative glycosyltransferase [Mycobacterium marseillense]